MPRLTDDRYELACQARAAGKGVYAAYLESGFTGKPAGATKFFQRPDIVARVTEIIADHYEDQRRIREIAVKEAGIDEAWIVKRLKYLADISLQGYPIKKDGVPTGALGKPDGPTAIRCLQLAAQMRGLLIQKHEVGQPGDFQRMSDEELNESLMEQGEALGLPSQALEKLLALPKPDGTVQ